MTIASWSLKDTIRVLVGFFRSRQGTRGATKHLQSQVALYELWECYLGRAWLSRTTLVGASICVMDTRGRAGVRSDIQGSGLRKGPSSNYTHTLKHNVSFSFGLTAFSYYTLLDTKRKLERAVAQPRKEWDMMTRRNRDDTSYIGITRSGRSTYIHTYISTYPFCLIQRVPT